MHPKNSLATGVTRDYSTIPSLKSAHIAHSYTVKFIVTDVVESKGLHGWESSWVFMEDKKIFRNQWAMDFWILVEFILCLSYLDSILYASSVCR